MYSRLVAEIQQLTQKQKPVIVGISGYGGSGKTTLAERLAKKFHLSDRQIIHLDNFFSENHQNKPIFEDYDWPVITAVLQRSRVGDRLRYIGRGFYGEKIEIDEPMPSILIIEGVRLFRPKIMSFFDVAVWIDCSPETAALRGEQRDRQEGADEEHVSRWRSEWLPKDNEYAERYQPKKLATFLYRDDNKFLS